MYKSDIVHKLCMPVAMNKKTIFTYILLMGAMHMGNTGYNEDFIKGILISIKYKN